MTPIETFLLEQLISTTVLPNLKAKALARLKELDSPVRSPLLRSVIEHLEGLISPPPAG